ncbi:hypothetical protein PAPHI01_1317 [Pancytospora philotis]|nr:hypothetical protein PAPHI01_1317 [Pancytospora philotis]
MTIADLVAHMTALVQSLPSTSGFEVRPMEEYALDLAQTTDAYDAVLESCRRANTGRCRSFKLKHRRYNVNHSIKQLRGKKTFIKLVVLSETDPYTLIHSMLDKQSYRTMEALHDIIFSTSWNNIKVMLQPNDYNAHSSTALYRRLHENSADVKLDPVKAGLCRRMSQETKKPWRAYMQSKRAQGLESKIEPVDAFLYLLRRVASHGADFDEELRGILESVFAWDGFPLPAGAADSYACNVPDSTKRQLIIYDFIERFMKRVLSLKNFRDNHQLSCKRILVSVAARIKTLAAYKVAASDIFLAQPAFSVADYIKNGQSAKITTHFAVNFSCTSAPLKRLRERGALCDVLFDFFINEVETRRAHPRMQELLQNDVLMDKLPVIFYYRIFDLLSTNGAVSDIRDVRIIKSLSSAFPEDKYHAVKKLAEEQNNTNLLSLLNERSVAPSAPQRSPTA